MIGAAHSLSAHVAREIQRGGRERGGGCAWAQRGMRTGKGIRGPERRDRSSSRTRGERKQGWRGSARRCGFPLPASNFKGPDDHLKRRSHPSWSPYPGLVLSRLVPLAPDGMGLAIWIQRGGLWTLPPGLRSSPSFQWEKKRTRRLIWTAHLRGLRVLDPPNRTGVFEVYLCLEPI